MHARLLPFLFFCAVIGAPGLDATFGDCTHCQNRPDEESVLAIVSPEALCMSSIHWGKELHGAFVSEIFLVDTKKWQARTIMTCQNGVSHHILFPFIVDTGGATKIGIRATRILESFGAAEDRREHLKICGVVLALPIRAQDCVYRWADYQDGVRDLDDGHDIRNNMIGDNDADLIVAIQPVVSMLKRHELDFDEGLDALMVGLAKYSPLRADLSLELRLALAAPPQDKLFETIAAKRAIGSRVIPASATSIGYGTSSCSGISTAPVNSSINDAGVTPSTRLLYDIDHEGKFVDSEARPMAAMAEKAKRTLARATAADAIEAASALSAAKIEGTRAASAAIRKAALQAAFNDAARKADLEDAGATSSTTQAPDHPGTAGDSKSESSPGLTMGT